MSDTSATADASDPSKAGEEAGQTDKDMGGGGEGGPEEPKMETSTAAQDKQREWDKLKEIRVGSPAHSSHDVNVWFDWGNKYIYLYGQHSEDGPESGLKVRGNDY